MKTLKSPKNRNLAGQLRTARTKSGSSLKQTAPAVGVDYTHLSKIENGVATPSPALLQRLVAYYQIEEADDVYAAAGLLPPDIARILAMNGRNAYEVLRERFSEYEQDSR